MKLFSNNVLRNFAFLFFVAALGNLVVIWQMLQNGGTPPFGITPSGADMFATISTFVGLVAGVSALVMIRPWWIEVSLLVALTVLVVVVHYVLLAAIPDQVTLTYTLEDFAVDFVLLSSPIVMCLWAAAGFTWASYVSNEKRRA